MNNRFSLHLIIILIIAAIALVSIPLFAELSWGAPWRNGKASPGDSLPESHIIFMEREREFLLDLNHLNIPFTKPPKVWLQGIPDTNSMNPVLDAGHNIILIGAADEENQKILCDSLKVGDICTYTTPQGVLLHRIVDISSDEKGRKFTFKGDNSWPNDPWAVRDEHIQFLCVGILY